MLQNASRSTSGTYPSDSNGYGFLDMSDIYFNRGIGKLDEIINLDKYLNRKDLNENINIYKRQTDPYINSAFVYFNNEEAFYNSLSELNLENYFRRLSENSGIFLGTETQIIFTQQIFNIEEVVIFEGLIEMSLLSEVSSGTAGGFFVNEDQNINYIKNNPNLNVTGRNVIIAVADSGIDYLHPDFINADGSSKILYLWDQSIEGNPPDGFYFGTEYTREDINKAISENDRSLSSDDIGSGTLLSGICAGLGIGN